MVLCLLAAALLRIPGLEQTPPGLHYDEAANVVLAREIGLQGERPIFISSYTGKEVLFFYLAGAMMRIAGPSAFALRLTAAFVGLLTVAATYTLGRALLADRRLAVLAAALLAISFWHLVFSRLGFRAIGQPLLQALAVLALFRGLRQPHWRWFVLAGLFLGLTAYTYLAARLFPLPLLLALLPVLASGRQRLLQLGLVGVVALAVLAPLLLYFWRHPDAFWVRIDQVAPAESLTVGQSYLRSLGMFFLVGDPYWRFNLPGRPLFNWLWGGLGLVGWGSLLWRWRHWWYDWQKAAVLLLLLVPWLMILPTALAVGEIVPSNLRAIGLIPFIFFLPALGLLLLMDQIARLLRRPGQNLGPALGRLSLFDGYDLNVTFVALLILLAGSAVTARLYFQEWGRRADLFYDSDGDLVAVAEFLAQEAPPADHLYVAAEHYRHPTLAALSSDYERIRWLPGSQALALPAAGSALYVFPHSSPAPAWARPYLAQGERLPGPSGPGGETLFEAFYLPQPAGPAVAEPLDATFGGAVTLLGYEVETGTSGDTLPLLLVWRIDSPLPGAPRSFVHLLDAWGHRWSQLEADAYPAEQWATGDVVVQRVDLPLPDGLPPGSYRLRLGLFNEQTGNRLPRLDEEGRYAGDSALIEQVTVVAGPPPAEQPTAPQGVPVEVRPGLTLLGYERGAESTRTGDTLPLALWWWASLDPPRLSVRLELYDGSRGRLLANSQPAHGTYPFSRWRAPAFVVDRLDPAVPLNLPPGRYRLQLRVLDEAGGTLHTSDLGPLVVEATERTFTPPPVDSRLEAAFGGEIALLGYNLEQATPNRANLELVWQAIEAPAAAYHVFVHLLRPDGSCCVWQSDAMPRGGSYPTDRWLPGEVVAESYEIVLPANLEPGQYPLEVGLFLLENGRRLVASSPGLPEDDAVDLQPLTIP